MRIQFGFVTPEGIVSCFVFLFQLINTESIFETSVSSSKRNIKYASFADRQSQMIMCLRYSTRRTSLNLPMVVNISYILVRVKAPDAGIAGLVDRCNAGEW